MLSVTVASARVEAVRRVEGEAIAVGDRRIRCIGKAAVAAQRERSVAGGRILGRGQRIAEGVGRRGEHAGRPRWSFERREGVQRTLNGGRLVVDVDRHRDGVAELQAVECLVLEAIRAIVSGDGLVDEVAVGEQVEVRGA